MAWSVIILRLAVEIIPFVVMVFFFFKIGSPKPIKARKARIRLADIVLDSATKSEIHAFMEYATDTGRQRERDPLLPAGAAAIFSGPPGTGKTIMAEAIAHGLEMKFLRLSPGDLLTCRIGGTERLIKRAFASAERAKHLLFIDEAEGMFLDRRAATRSWETTQVNELLQRVEAFRGVLIIATNYTEMLDPAFARRFSFHIYFNLPDRDTRSALWKKWKPKLNVTAKEIELLSRDFELSPGEIRNVVARAIVNKDVGAIGLSNQCRIAMASRTGIDRQLVCRVPKRRPSKVALNC